MSDQDRRSESAVIDAAVEQQKDRRRSYRITIPDTETPVRAELTFPGGSTIPAEIINYSRVGMLCYSPHDANLYPDQVIPKIKLFFERKDPVQLTGKIVRLEKGEAKLFCGIRFLETEKPGRPIRRQETFEVTEAIRLKWVRKLQAIPNYMAIDNLEEQVRAEREAYECFYPVAGNLSIEERWWFFEMLDELKRREPFYPSRLLLEFVAVCEWGFVAINEPPWNVPARGFLHTIRSLWDRIKLFFLRKR